jgi:predicted HAD superfamily Cof-like phosphohydrolase
MPHILLQQVLEFHKKFKRYIGDPRTPMVHDVDFRMRLLDEEYEELEEALDDPTLTDKERIIKLADALGDMVYVIFGTAICWGIDLASVLDAIHTSNMTKSLENLRADGKVLKGPEYQPPEIEQALECAASDADRDGFDGDDAWWPTPTIEKAGVSFMPEFKVTDVIHDKIMLAAKEQAKLLAMKSINEDFVSVEIDDDSEDIEIDEDEPTQPWEEDDLRPTEEGFQAVEQALSNGVPEGIQGEMTAYGAFIFTCPCGRTHGVQAKLGSRGGLAPDASCACMCGNAFVIDFAKGANPHVTVTTIEEQRKVENA